MKSGCYEFGYYCDNALRVNNESDTYELIEYDYDSKEFQSLLISREKAEFIFNRYNLSDDNLIKEQ